MATADAKRIDDAMGCAAIGWFKIKCHWSARRSSDPRQLTRLVKLQPARDDSLQRKVLLTKDVTTLDRLAGQREREQFHYGLTASKSRRESELLSGNTTTRTARHRLPSLHIRTTRPSRTLPLALFPYCYLAYGFRFRLTSHTGSRSYMARTRVGTLLARH